MLSTRKTTKWLISKTAFLRQVFLLIIFVSTSKSFCADNKQQESESVLLDKYIESLPYSSKIMFDPSNIKQFWVDNSVFSKNDSINIILSNYQSTLLPVKLANIYESYDCKVDVISADPNLNFSVLDNKKKNIISNSSTQDKFLNYNVVSTTFHLENTNELLFHLKFNSDKQSIPIKRIILSFSENKQSSFFLSPGTFDITKDNITFTTDTQLDSKEFIVSGKKCRIFSNNKIFVQDNVFRSSVKVKNIGKAPTNICLGYEAHFADGSIIWIHNYPYKNTNQLLSVVSAHKGEDKLIVDTYPEWEKRCHIAINAKEDLSDIPNESILNGFNGAITDIKKLDNGYAEIIMNSPLKEDLQPGTKIRIHGTFSGWIFPRVQLLQPGEEAVLTSTIQKESDCFEYSSKAFSKGVYYVVPILFSESVKPNEENSVQISDFSVSF